MCNISAILGDTTFWHWHDAVYVSDFQLYQLQFGPFGYKANSMAQFHKACHKKIAKHTKVHLPAKNVYEKKLEKNCQAVLSA